MHFLNCDTLLLIPPKNSFLLPKAVHFKSSNESINDLSYSYFGMIFVVDEKADFTANYIQNPKNFHIPCLIYKKDRNKVSSSKRDPKPNVRKNKNDEDNQNNSSKKKYKLPQHSTKTSNVNNNNGEVYNSSAPVQSIRHNGGNSEDKTGKLTVLIPNRPPPSPFDHLNNSPNSNLKSSNDSFSPVSPSNNLTPNVPNYPMNNQSGRRKGGSDTLLSAYNGPTSIDPQGQPSSQLPSPNSHQLQRQFLQQPQQTPPITNTLYNNEIPTFNSPFPSVPQRPAQIEPQLRPIQPPQNYYQHNQPPPQQYSLPPLPNQHYPQPQYQQHHPNTLLNQQQQFPQNTPPFQQNQFQPHPLQYQQQPQPPQQPPPSFEQNVPLLMNNQIANQNLYPNIVPPQPITPPCQSISVIKLHSFGNTCYLNVSLQMLFIILPSVFPTNDSNNVSELFQIINKITFKTDAEDDNKSDLKKLVKLVESLEGLKINDLFNQQDSSVCCLFYFL